MYYIMWNIRVKKTHQGRLCWIMCNVFVFTESHSIWKATQKYMPSFLMLLNLRIFMLMISLFPLFVELEVCISLFVWWKANKTHRMDYWKIEQSQNFDGLRSISFYRAHIMFSSFLSFYFSLCNVHCIILFAIVKAKRYQFKIQWRQTIKRTHWLNH